MKNKLLATIVCIILTVPHTVYAETPTDSIPFLKIELVCQKVNTGKAHDGIHRTPPTIPNIYLDEENATLYFENACYDCTLELVIPGTETSVYSAVIPDGADTFLLPTGFTGSYELHIHRGNYCFWGTIVL